mmetsp:Transcript_65998/g.212900  ORF Transcript_65998/g.212900 Transcript_65998/m.212900 type:complete len:249 (+) Transcript_65998:171-917(+)
MASSMGWPGTASRGTSPTPMASTPRRASGPSKPEMGRSATGGLRGAASRSLAAATMRRTRGGVSWSSLSARSSHSVRSDTFGRPPPRRSSLTDPWARGRWSVRTASVPSTSPRGRWTSPQSLRARGGYLTWSTSGMALAAARSATRATGTRTMRITSITWAASLWAAPSCAAPSRRPSRVATPACRLQWWTATGGRQSHMRKHNASGSSSTRRPRLWRSRASGRRAPSRSAMPSTRSFQILRTRAALL